MSDEPHVPGFWLRVIEADARLVAAGQLPDTVQRDMQQLLHDYDAHLARGQRQLDRTERQESDKGKASCAR